MIILLNGTSSSGKSTLAKHLLSSLPEPFIFHSFDSLIPAMVPHEDSFHSFLESDARTYARKLDGNFYRRINDRGLSLISACYKCIPVFAREGFNIIVESIFWPDILLDFSEMLLPENKVFLVGVHCPLDVLRQREAKRGDRNIGNAEKQFKELHRDIVYDIEVNTHEMTYPQCTNRIAKHIYEHEPFALSEIRSMLQEKSHGNPDYPI